MTEIKVFNKKGGYVRSYSLEVHGEGFTELADEFAKKIGGSINEPRDANSLIAKALANDSELKAKADELLAPKFCDACNSKGRRHKKECPKVVKEENDNATQG